MMETTSRRLRASGFAAVCVAVSFLLAKLAHPYGSLEDLAMIHLFGIVVLALRSGVRVSLLATLFSIAIFDFFFIKPELQFAWSDVRSGLTFLTMILVALTVSSLSQNLRRQEQRARAVAIRSQALYELNVELSTSQDVRKLAAVTARHIEKLFAAQVSILLETADGALEAASGPRSSARAQSAWLRREFTTQSAPSGTLIWVPVKGIRSTLGVIEVEVGEAFERDSEQGYLLMACASQFGTAVESGQFANAVQRAQLEAEAERLRSSLLSAVSHDLKTPLATMIAAGTTLASKRRELSDDDAEVLIRSIVSQGHRLNRLIHNLLSVTRLESPSVELRKTPESIEDIVRSALERLGGRNSIPRISAEYPALALPLVSVEPVLLEQVLVNLLENALQHAKTDVLVTFSHLPRASSVTVQVVDRGPGIAEHEREKVFEKFFRGTKAAKGDGGVGLGLTICRAIVRAHGGRIAIREREGGGTVVEFTVPVQSEQVLALEAAS